MNTSDSRPSISDPDDILDIVVQQPSLTIPQVPAALAAPSVPAVRPPVSGAGSVPVPALTEPTQPNDGWRAVPSQYELLDSRTVEPAPWTGNGLPTVDEYGALEDKEPHWVGMMVREVVETVGLAVIIFLIIRIGIQNYRIEGQSMEPNFHDGEYLIVNKLAYRLGEYERGDVIVFKYPNDPSKDYIKRVIGLPGDTVEIRGGQLFVNDNQIDEPYPHMPNVRDEIPMVVEAGHLYVMGDNRPASSDTRSWGQLGQEFVIGQAWLAIWPFEQAGLVEHHTIDVNAVMAQGP